jgi:hypothetical protein
MSMPDSFNRLFLMPSGTSCRAGDAYKSEAHLARKARTCSSGAHQVAGQKLLPVDGKSAPVLGPS